MRLSWILIGLTFVACNKPQGETFDAEPQADADLNRAPAAPEIMEPADGRIDVLPHTLKVVASAYSDPDGDAAGDLEVELFNVGKNKSIKERVWVGRGRGDTLIAEGGMFAAEGMEPWEDYAIRVRYWDTAAVAKPSEWSAFRFFHTDDGSIELFSGDKIHDLNLVVPPESIAALNAQAGTGCSQKLRQYYVADVEVEGKTYPGVGIHTKGGCGSARDFNGKPSLRINFNWNNPAVPNCPETRSWRGQKALTVNNGVQDTSLVHERLGYVYYRALGVKAPRAVPIRVSVNGTYYGLYNLIETPTRRFFERRGLSGDGELYEGAYWCDLVAGNLPQGNNDDRCLQKEFRKDECDDPTRPEPNYDALRGLVSQLDAMPGQNFSPAIDDIWDYDTFLSEFAAHTVLGHWDAYTFSIMNNYRVYRDPDSQKWTMIPTGIDQTFGADMSAWSAQARLARNCLDQPACQTRFVEKLKNAVTVFEQLQLDQLAVQYYNEIKESAHRDVRKSGDNGTFDAANRGLVDWIRNRPAQVRADIAARGF